MLKIQIDLQLIINAKNMPELPISPKMKKCADQMKYTILGEQ